MDSGVVASIAPLAWVTGAYFIVHFLAYYAWKYFGVKYEKFSYSDRLTFPEK